MAKKQNSSAPPNTSTVSENGEDRIITLSGMYQEYFLDYASYVILERAVPAIEDGLKPVQRRIMHAMFEQHDGRYHKVANLIGQTMQYHPHGDAAIGEALVNLGQKDLLIDCQGNWGDIRTGDSAAAARYIEARLTKFAIDILFNRDTTEWQLTYDGRKREPVALPAKFPLLLAQGVEGIAVGLSTKIMPHNFIELIKASVDVLRGKPTNILPDFQTGGMMDPSSYNGGKRGGKISVRAKIEKVDQRFLAIKELPYGVTTGDMIDSILKAAEKGKIKIKKVTDNTAADVEVLIELVPGVSPDVTIDALYAFTDCQVSISPNCCIIVDNKPMFWDVNTLLKVCTEQTKELLKRELEIKKHDLEEKWHFASLEKIFIENRIYRDIENSESYAEALSTIRETLKKYVVTPADDNKQKADKRVHLLREITQEDLERLTEIRIKRISKYNAFAADEMMAKLLEELVQTKHDLEHLTEFTIAFYQELLKKYGKGRERKTLIVTFDAIQATEVVANNAKLYVNKAEGFIGKGIKKDEFVCDCSDIDDIIVIRRDGKLIISRVADKTFVGKDILYVNVWRKNDERTVYNVIYFDGKEGTSFVKRFNVTGITRDKEYDLTKGTPHSKLLYLSVNPNGEAETVTVQLTQGCKAKIKKFEFDFSELDIKNRGANGNTLTKYPISINGIKLKEAGKSTLGAQQIWWDDITSRINKDGRGRLLGEFDTGNGLLILYPDGSYEVADVDFNRRIEAKDILEMCRFDNEQVISAVHFDGNKGWTMCKRFKVETTSHNQRFPFLTDHKDSKLLFASLKPNPRISYTIKVKSQKMEGEVSLAEFIDVKGWKAIGNRISDQKLGNIKEIAPEVMLPSEKLQAGDTVEFAVNGKQEKLFE